MFDQNRPNPISTLPLFSPSLPQGSRIVGVASKIKERKRVDVRNTYCTSVSVPVQYNAMSRGRKTTNQMSGRTPVETFAAKPLAGWTTFSPAFFFWPCRGTSELSAAWDTPFLYARRAQWVGGRSFPKPAGSQKARSEDLCHPGLRAYPHQARVPARSSCPILQRGWEIGIQPLGASLYRHMMIPSHAFS